MLAIQGVTTNIMAGGDTPQFKGNEASDQGSADAKENTRHLSKLQDDSLFSKNVDKVVKGNQPKDSSDQTKLDERIKEIAEVGKKMAEEVAKSMSSLQEKLSKHPDAMLGLLKDSVGHPAFEQTLIKGLLPPTNDEERKQQQQMLASIKSAIEFPTKLG